MVTNFYYIQYRGMQLRTAKGVRLILKLYVNDCLLWKELYFDVHGLKVATILSIYLNDYVSAAPIRQITIVLSIILFILIAQYRQ